MGFRRSPERSSGPIVMIFMNYYGSYPMLNSIIMVFVRLSARLVTLFYGTFARGYYWIEKLKSMLENMQTSKEVMKNFKRQNRDIFNTFDYDIKICEYRKWPVQTTKEVQKKFRNIHPPDQLADLSCTLKRFYENKYRGRKFFICWDKGMGEVLVTN